MFKNRKKNVWKQERMFENRKRMFENRKRCSKLEKGCSKTENLVIFFKKVFKSAIAHRTSKTSHTHALRTHNSKYLSARTSARTWNVRKCDFTHMCAATQHLLSSDHSLFINSVFKFLICSSPFFLVSVFYKLSQFLCIRKFFMNHVNLTKFFIYLLPSRILSLVNRTDESKLGQEWDLKDVKLSKENGFLLDHNFHKNSWKKCSLFTFPICF